MKRLAAVAGLVGAVAFVVPFSAHAASTQVVSCAHIHLTYTFQAGDPSFPVAASASDCVNGTAASTSVTGSGTGTFRDTVLGTSCPRGGDVQCLNFALTLSIGGTAVAPSFDTLGYVYPPVFTDLPPTTFDYAEADTIQDFGSGGGAGAFNTICTFNNPYENCTVDGSFTWAPGA